MKDAMTDHTASTIKEIHLINLSHTDFGYTDLPSSAWDYLVNNIRIAMKYIEETSNYPEDSRFKWTVETLWILERFWAQASEKEKILFDQLVENGSIEVTAMPGNMSCLVDLYEWENELDRLAPFYNKYKPRVAIMNDANGLPWGIVDSLFTRDIKYFVMGVNLYSGGVPIPAPSVFSWEGAKNNKILMYNGDAYFVGYDYFHAKDWRQGPVPNRYDIWFNQPAGNEIFSSKKEDILASYEILKKKLDKLSQQGYSNSVMQVTFTNHWTGDNDLPCRQLSDFVKAWNEMGLLPRIIFSTPSKFFEKIIAELPSDHLTLKGEWCDWWADGVSSTPFEVSILQSAKRRNKDIGNMLKYFGISSPEISKKIIELNHDLVFASEHTWGAYDSVARPYCERTGGNYCQKFDYFYRVDENSKRIQSEILRLSDHFKPFSQTRNIEVLNPGSLMRSGWVEISAHALRIEANGVREKDTNRFLPFEKTLAAEWSLQDDVSENSHEIPNDVWAFSPGKYRFYLENIRPGESRKFELANEPGYTLEPIKTSRFFRPVISEQTGQIINVVYLPLNKSLFDEQTCTLPCQLIVERPQGKYSRLSLLERNLDSNNILYNSPLVLKNEKIDSSYSLRYHITLEEEFAKRIEQQWDIFDSIPRIEITTTIWLKENLDPLAVYIAFPFAIKSPRIFYDSLGNMVEVGVDQIPNTCGQFSTVQNWVSYEGEDIRLTLNTPDLPIGIFDSIVRNKRRTTFKPETGNFYSLVCQNYWVTNFAVLKPAKLVLHHIIECGNPSDEILPLDGTELWGYPSI
jgi:hypothetical protein